MENRSTTPTGTEPAASSTPTGASQERSPFLMSSPDRAEPPPPPGAGPAEDAQRLAKQGAEEMSREARELKDDARQTAADVKEKVAGATAQAAEQARVQAGRITAQLREQGTSAINQQKARAADLIGDCVAATRRASQKLHEEDDHNLGDYADMLAERLDSAGRYLREQDAGRMVNDAADLARRKPEWVLGGAFVLGLVAARFLKASRPEGAAYGSYRYDEGYGGMHGSALGTSGTHGSSEPPYGASVAPGDTTAGPTGRNDVAVVAAAPGAAPASVATTASGSWSAGSLPTTTPQAERPEVM